jgi:hypothetical protein
VKCLDILAAIGEVAAGKQRFIHEIAIKRMGFKFSSTEEESICRYYLEQPECRYQQPIRPAKAACGGLPSCG